MTYTLVNGHELLQLTGSFGCSEAIAHARYQATYGQGYKTSLIVDGAETGMKSWKLQFKTLIRTMDKTAFLGDDEFNEADYLWDFYCRYAVSGEPFVIQSLRNFQYYLAEFSDPSLSYELFATRLFTVGVGLDQRRKSNVYVFYVGFMGGTLDWFDASALDLENGDDVTELRGVHVPLDTSPPTAPTDFVGRHGTGTIGGSFGESFDDESGIDHYEVEITYGD